MMLFVEFEANKCYSWVTTRKILSLLLSGEIISAQKQIEIHLFQETSTKSLYHLKGNIHLEIRHVKKQPPVKKTFLDSGS